MAESALAKKLKLKSGLRAAVIYAPSGYLDALEPLPAGVELTERLQGQFDWVQAFIRNKAELDKLVPKILDSLKPEGLLWLTFPKGSSKIQTDLARDKGWDALRGANLRWITLVSVDDTWSAFSLRPSRPGEKPQSSRWPA